jgi:hypothetical protein
MAYLPIFSQELVIKALTATVVGDSVTVTAKIIVAQSIKHSDSLAAFGAEEPRALNTKMAICPGEQNRLFNTLPFLFAVKLNPIKKCHLVFFCYHTDISR